VAPNNQLENLNHETNPNLNFSLSGILVVNFLITGLCYIWLRISDIILRTTDAFTQ